MLCLLRRPSTLAIFAWGGTLSAFSAGLNEHAGYQAAQRAFADGLPAVAAVKAEQLLNATQWDSAERSTLAQLAVASWLRARDGRRIHDLLAKEEIPQEPLRAAQAWVLMGDLKLAEKQLLHAMSAGGGDEEQFLLAQVELAQGQLTLARQALEPLLNSKRKDLADRARLMLAEIEAAAGNDERAVAQTQALQSAAPENTAVAALISARALVKLGRHEEAQERLRAIFSGTGGGEAVHHGAAILRAESLLAQGQVLEAVEALVQFLDHTVESEAWAQAFDLLTKAFATGGPAVTPPPSVVRWIVDGNAAQQILKNPLPGADAETNIFRGHAALLAVRWLLEQQRLTEAAGLLEAFLVVHANHPAIDEAMRMALETYGALRIDSRVTVLAAQWRRRFAGGASPMVAAVTGGAAYSRGDFTTAATHFQEAAQLAATAKDRRSALFNAGISALKAGEVILYQTLLGQLAGEPSGTDETGESAADLELAKALSEAAAGQTGAEAGLRQFLEDHPKHPRAPEVRVALAESLLLAPEPDFRQVAAALAAASRADLEPALRQRLAYVRLWLAEKQGNLKAVTEAGAEFLKNWPEADRAAEVRMKVADAYFRLGNFASAGTEFELVVKEHENSPYADTALYFAGLSALSMIGVEGREHAITLWQQLAEKGGPLSIPARQQQALAKVLDDKPEEALKLFDNLLTEKSLNDDLRWSLACEKAEILIRLGKTKPERLAEAVDTLRQLRATDRLTYLWQARTGHTLAWALNEAGRPKEALEACYDVVRPSAGGAPSNPAEYRWYYRAGFFGIDLLKAEKQWESAARLAELLAQSKGERAAEAKEQANTIRLEHFLWDTQTK